jgi:hypothetical protein
MEIVVIDRTDSSPFRAAFTDQLRQKSRHRRDRQERLPRLRLPALGATTSFRD